MKHGILFGKKIRELRLAKQLSQRELADRVAARLKEEEGKGFTFTYLSKIENSRLDPPSAAAIKQLAFILDADSDELLALAGKTPTDVGEMLEKSQGARVFFRSAFAKGLSEDDWQSFIDDLRKKKR